GGDIDVRPPGALRQRVRGDLCCELPVVNLPGHEGRRGAIEGELLANGRGGVVALLDLDLAGILRRGEPGGELSSRSRVTAGSCHYRGGAALERHRVVAGGPLRQRCDSPVSGHVAGDAADDSGAPETCRETEDLAPVELRVPLWSEDRLGSD